MTRKLSLLFAAAFILVAFFAFRPSMNTLEIGDAAPMTAEKMMTTAKEQLSLEHMHLIFDVNVFQCIPFPRERHILDLCRY